MSRGKGTVKQLDSEAVGLQLRAEERAAGGRLQAARLNTREQMKHASKLFLALCLTLCLGAVAANAQIESDVTIEANIPYSFVVEKTTLPAGKYMVRAADEFADPSILEIRSADGRHAVIFETEGTRPKQMPTKTELVFNKVGDTYFLSEVLVDGDNTGNRLPRSRMEERLEGKGMKAETHSVAALAKPFKKAAKKL